MKGRSFPRLLLLLMSGFPLVVHAETVVFGPGGKVVGISELAVNTNGGLRLFDVAFLDGTCIALVPGCSEYGNVFNYNLIQDSVSSILGALGEISNTPELINGCESALLCNIFIPQQTSCCSDSVTGIRLEIHAGTDNERALSGFVGMTMGRDLTLYPGSTYAVFTPSSAVPIPASGLLLGSALICLVAARRFAATRLPGVAAA